MNNNNNNNNSEFESSDIAEPLEIIKEEEVEVAEKHNTAPSVI